MYYYGDVSGDFRGLLNGHCDVVVVGVVGGGKIDCMRCPKKTVRRIDDIPEAKWNDLTDVQKRRFFDCFTGQEDVRYGYAQFDKEMLHTMDNYHHIYQDVCFPPDWDLALTGYAYGEILYEMDVTDDRHQPIFEFDRVASKQQSVDVKEHVEEYVPDANIFIQGSRQSHGIQAADCLAGGIAEDEKNGTDWLNELSSDRVTHVGYHSLLKLETDLGKV